MAEDLTVTGLLHEASRGDREALDRLVPRVYETLRGLAHRELRRERPGHTLSATALAHEAYIKLIGLERIEWRDRSHFFAMAARSMRRILVDYAMSRKAQKRGGGAVPVSLTHDDLPALANETRLEELLAVDEALTRLEAAAPLVVRIVECRVFAGMTIDETAAVLELSPATVKRHWTTARAWLNRELSAEARSDG